MYYVPRGGNRGGADQFKWEDVKEDKGRECYLGHSLMAPVGRWQKNKDLQWFSKGKAINSNSNISDEIQAARNAEREAMLIALGHKVGDRLAAETMQPQREATLPKLESARSKSAKKKKKKHKEEKRNKRKIEENHKSSHKKRKKKHRRRDSSDDTESSSENESSPDRSSESEREVSAKKRKQDGDNDRRRRESNDHRHRDRHNKNSRERDRRKRDGSRDRSKMKHHDKR